MITLASDEGAPCVSGETRLVNNGTINNDSGIVEICAGGRWSTVCAGTTFGNSEARVICRQLGHTNPESKRSHSIILLLCTGFHDDKIILIVIFEHIM